MNRCIGMLTELQFKSKDAVENITPGETPEGSEKTLWSFGGGE